jgi:tRNA(Ile)-lysidine synthetase-like protein
MSPKKIIAAQVFPHKRTHFDRAALRNRDRLPRMRLPLLVSRAIRSRQLIAPGGRVLIALSGGPDSVALLHCMLELSRKRDLAFELCAAHLNHRLRGKSADADERFCARLCARKKIPLLRASVDTPKLAAVLKRSIEETARIARHAFLHQAALRLGGGCVAVAHHGDDRIETVLYRLCRGTGLAGLQGIGWSGPLKLEDEPDVGDWLTWREPAAPAMAQQAGGGETPLRVVRPLLGCARKEILAYLKTKRQACRTDETNFDVRIPRNALRNLVLPMLEEKVHPGARAALGRLAEEAEVQYEKRAWRREWLAGFASLEKNGSLSLPVSKLGPPPDEDEISDALSVLQAAWNLGATSFGRRHAQALRALFIPASGPKTLSLSGNLAAERRHKTVTIKRL